MPQKNEMPDMTRLDNNIAPTYPEKPYGSLGIVLSAPSNLDTGEFGELKVVVTRAISKFAGNTTYSLLLPDFNRFAKIEKCPQSFYTFLDIAAECAESLDDALLKMKVTRSNQRPRWLLVEDIQVPEFKFPEPLGKYKIKSSNQLQVLLEKLMQHGKPSQYAPFAELDTKTHVTSEMQLRALFDACRSSYPPTIIKCALDNFDILQNDKASDTDKRHARDALVHVLNIDWNVPPPVNLPSIEQAKAILNAELYGLTSAKERFLDILSKISTTGKYPNKGILLIGPAGTGKTKIAKVFAEILGRPSIFMDMSSIIDAEALTGSSRIYSNAKPGFVVDQMFKNESANCTVIINELDKADNGASKKGNAAEALLTLIDGMGFMDNFLEASIPSVPGMFFIATANDKNKISKPMLSRFQCIEIPGYRKDEKQVIVQKYILPKMLNDLGIPNDAVTLTPAATRVLCGEYAIGPGIRELESYVESIVDRYTRELSAGGDSCRVFKTADIQRVFGPSHAVKRSMTTRPGVVMSAYCDDDGRSGSFPIEAVAMPGGSGRFETIGIQDDVTISYCKAAYLCLRRAARNVDFSKLDVTVYIPQPIPKSRDNFVGIGAYAAIASAVMGDVVFTTDAAFIGGVDLYGNTFFDSTDLSPYLYKLEEIDVHTVYAPIGASEAIYGKVPDGIEIVEGENIEVLLSTAVSNSSHNSYLDIL